MDAYILNHFSNLRAKSAAKALEKQQATVVEPLTPLTPLVQRLKKFVESLDTEQRSKPQALEFFREGLRGRQSGRKAHAGELGACLRKINYTRRRAWNKSEGGFRALWWPPK